MILRACVAGWIVLAASCGSGGGAGSSGTEAQDPTHAAGTSGIAGGEAQPGAGDDAAPGSSAETFFAIHAVPQPPYAVGGEARAEVTLEARNGYHVNQEYPIELRMQAPAGVDLAKARLVRGDASTFDEARAVFPVSFTPREAGRKEFAGELRFSVCDETNCLLERRPIHFAVDVP